VTKLHALSLAVAIVVVGTIAVQTHAATPKLAPPVICNMESRLDIFVDEDSILWECNCQVLARGFICHWQVIGGVDAVKSRRYLKLHRHAIRLYPIAVTG
jgi:hypothetical protein